jgi:Spectrin repeat
VEAHLKAHDAFQNLVAQQEEKVASLREHADKLVRQKHFDAATIAAKLAEIQEKRAAVAELCTHKTNLLNLNYLYAKFMQVMRPPSLYSLSVLPRGQNFGRKILEGPNKNLCGLKKLIDASEKGLARSCQHGSFSFRNVILYTVHICIYCGFIRKNYRI